MNKKYKKIIFFIILIILIFNTLNPIAYANINPNIICIGEKSYGYKKDIIKGLSYFPIETIEKFIAKDGTIIITDENSNEYTYSNIPVEGIYYPETNTIIIFTNNQHKSFMTGHVETICHEMGHFIYDEILTTQDKQIISIYYNSKNRNIFTEIIKDDYCETNEQEFFAEIVSHMVRPYKYETIKDCGFLFLFERMIK